MPLLLAERAELTVFVMDFGQNDLDAFLARAGCPGIAQFSSATQPIPVIAIHLLEWLDLNGQWLVPLMRRAVAEFPMHPSKPAFDGAILRLERAAVIRTTQNPWDACLASDVPVVNRVALRGVLCDLAAGRQRAVTLVDGPSGSGRTHSWHLIQHVAAALPGLRIIKLDLDANVAEQQTMQNIFRRLDSKLKLHAHEPSTTGATPETIAGRYAEEVALAFDNQPALKAWIVFDSLDRPVPPEIKLFVCALVHRKLDHEMAGATLFLLGAGRNFGIADPFMRTHFESLSSFLDADVDTAAQAVNAQGTRQLTPTVLAQRVAAMKQDLQIADVRQACTSVAKRLVELRVEVGA